MRIEEIIEKGYVPRLSIHLDEVKDDDIGEIAGMLRCLMCAIEGYGSIIGITNDLFSTSPVVLKFSNIQNAHYFKACVDYYFSDDILASLKVKKRIRRN